MELTKKGKKLTLKSDVQIAAYKKAGWSEIKVKNPKPKPDGASADTADK